VLGLLAQLREEGLTILMVTHEIGFARKSADRIVLLDGGKIIEDGPPEKVLDHSESERTREFLQQVIG
jgi:polar amino acid transport system ATP-binding protein